MMVLAEPSEKNLGIEINMADGTLLGEVTNKLEVFEEYYNFIYSK